MFQNSTADLSNVQPYDLPLDQGDAARAANAALFEGKRALQDAREGWALVKETFGEARGTLSEGGSPEFVARRLAVRLEQRAGKTLGLVSSSACGLWGITENGGVFQVDATDGGSDYLRGVRFVKVVNRVSGAVTWGEYDEIPVSSVAAFFDSFEALRSFMEPAPARTFLGR